MSENVQNVTTLKPSLKDRLAKRKTLIITGAVATTVAVAAVVFVKSREDESSDNEVLEPAAFETEIDVNTP